MRDASGDPRYREEDYLKGKQMAKIQIVKRMLQRDLKPSDIARLTECMLEEVEELVWELEDQ